VVAIPSWCVVVSEFERHHVAGRAHDPVTIELCTRCHKDVTRWQRALGIPLRHDADYTALDHTRAYLVGVALVAELTCRLFARIISMALDVPGDRRWSPRSTYDRDRGD